MNDEAMQGVYIYRACIACSEPLPPAAAAPCMPSLTLVVLFDPFHGQQNLPISYYIYVWSRTNIYSTIITYFIAVVVTENNIHAAAEMKHA